MCRCHMKRKDDVSDEIIFLFNSKNIKRLSLSFFHVSIAERVSEETERLLGFIGSFMT